METTSRFSQGILLLLPGINTLSNTSETISRNAPFVKDPTRRFARFSPGIISLLRAIKTLSRTSEPISRNAPCVKDSTRRFADGYCIAVGYKLEQPLKAWTIISPAYSLSGGCTWFVMVALSVRSALSALSALSVRSARVFQSMKT